MHWMLTTLPEVALVFMIGLGVGSFLNVCAWRMPEEEQVVGGRSKCRQCGKQVLWYDNLPVLSYLMLKGKCRSCQARIHWSYPLVELSTGLIWAGLVLRFGLTPLFSVYAVLAAALVLLSTIDFKHFYLPDEITLPGISLGIVLSYYVPALHGQSAGMPAVVAGILGALAGSGMLWAIRALGTQMFKREAMGLGDVKLMAMVGAFVGVGKVVLINIFLAPLLGAIFGLYWKNRSEGGEIPFGPFLAVGTGIAIVVGDAIIQWYLTRILGT